MTIEEAARLLAVLCTPGLGHTSQSFRLRYKLEAWLAEQVPAVRPEGMESGAALRDDDALAGPEN